MAIMSPKYPHLAAAMAQKPAPAAAPPPAAPAPVAPQPVATAPAAPPSYDFNGLYQSMFGRAPDASGLAYWQGQQGNYADTNAMKNALLGGATAADKAAYYGIQAGIAPTPAKPDLSGIINPFTQLLTEMNKNQMTAQTGYQQSMADLMGAWSSMANPQQPTPAPTGPEKDPYQAQDGIGQVSPVYNPYGQNGLSFGWNGSNPFAGTF